MTALAPQGDKKPFIIPNAGWLVLYTFLVTGYIYFVFSNWAYDDPFITYRYAKNLAQGVGFVYNSGEYIQSTTTPLFTILLAALSPFWDDLPRLANFIGAFSLAVGGVLLWYLARSWETPNAGWTLLLLYPIFPLLLSTLGSETPLYLMFCLGAFTFYARRQYTLVATLSALAVLTRPDGILVPILLAIDYLIRRRNDIPWKAILLFVVLTLPWFIFAWIYFGSPLPVTLAAKQHQGEMAISQRFAPGFISLAGAYTQFWHYKLETILALLGIAYMLLYARRWLLLLLWTILYFAAYTALGVSRYYWYYAPLVPGFLALVGLGIETLENLGKFISHKQRRHKPYQAIAKLLPTGITVFAIALLILGQMSDLRRLSSTPNARASIYHEVGNWLKENTPLEARVGTVEVGIIGYYAQRPIIGFAGLLQPETAKLLKKDTTYSDTAVWATERHHPEYLVLQSGYFPELEQGYIVQHCQMVQSFPGEAYGYETNMDIYACEANP